MAGEAEVLIQMSMFLNIIFLVATMGFLALSIMLLKFTPAMSFMRAKLKGQNILMVIRRDRKADFCVGKYSAGIIETKKYGDYITDPEGVINEKVSGIRFFIASTELGATISPKVAKLIQALQDMKIPNLRIAKMLASQLHLCETCNEEVFAIPKQEKGKNDVLVNYFECPTCHGKALKRLELTIDSPLIETLKFENLSKWSDTIMNPIYQAANKTLKVEEAIMDMKKSNMNQLVTLVGIGILLFLGALGLSILWPQIAGTAGTTIINQVAQNATK
jgi:hypothetical protein